MDHHDECGNGRYTDRSSAKKTLYERGASLVEYAFLVALIAIVCIVAVTFFGGETSTSFSESGSSIRQD